MRYCSHCDGLHCPKTYENQVAMPINGRVVDIDRCIHHIVAALNAGGVHTVSCCCGHTEIPGHIILGDGRVLIISEEKAIRDGNNLVNIERIRSQVYSVFAPSQPPDGK